MKAVISIMTILTWWSVVGLGQDKQLLPQEQQVVLDNPEVIRLEITGMTRRRSAGVYEKESGTFEMHSKPKFNLVATNTSIVPLNVRVWDSLAQNRPRLLRDNQEVPYREGIPDLLKQERDDSDIISIVVTRLMPNIPKLLEVLDLRDWYAPLEPGHYHLTTQHRFVQGGKGVESDSIVFEVEAKKKSNSETGR